MVKPEKKKIAKVVKKKRSRPSRSPNFTDLRAKLEKKRGSRSADFTELRDDLFREAAKLVAEDPSQSIAILVTPPASSSESNVAMQSFGYPSAESVVRKFLKDTAPVTLPEDDAEEEEEEEEEEEDEDDVDWSKYYWWEDEKLLNSKDPVEIMAAITEMEKLKKQLEHFVGSESGEGSGSQEDGSSKP